MNIKKLVVLNFLNLLISVPAFATAVEEKDINFMPSTVALMKGEVHVASKVISHSKLRKNFPDFSYLDSLGFSKLPNIKIVLSKSAYVVNKPAGFFDHLNSGNEEFLSHIMGEQKVKKLEENTFRVSIPGAEGNSYLMKTYFDSDDISTLPNSKVIRAVTQARKLDVISQSASATTFKELSEYSKYSVGGIQVSTFIPLKENKTLILSYTMNGVKKAFAKSDLLKKSLREEAEAQKKLIDDFKP